MRPVFYNPFILETLHLFRQSCKYERPLAHTALSFRKSANKNHSLEGLQTKKKTNILFCFLVLFKAAIRIFSIVPP